MREENERIKLLTFILLVLILILTAYSIYQDSKYIRTQIGEINKEAYLFTKTLQHNFKTIVITNINTNQSMKIEKR